MSIEQLSQKDVVTRKEFRCFACLRIFPAGSDMNVSTHVDNGKIYDLHCCPTCRELMNHIDPEDYEYAEGFVRDEMNGEYETPEALLESYIKDMVKP